MSEIKPKRAREREELLPCPFCGGKPKYSKSKLMSALVTVECSKCGTNCHFWRQKDLAAAFWNSRDEDERVQQLKSENERLRKALEVYAVVENWEDCPATTCDGKHVWTATGNGFALAQTALEGKE